MSINLDHLDETYAGAPEKESGDFEPVPDGSYRVGVKDIEIKTTKKDPPRPLLAWTLEITGPTHEGRLLWKNDLLVTPENLSYLKRDLKTCGITLAKLSDLGSRLSEIQGMKLAVSVKTRGEYTNVYINERVTDDVTPADDDGSAPPF